MTRKKEEHVKQVSFEDSLTELEEIVDALENDSLSLSEMISRYERGSHLLSNCDAFLKSAKLRLEKLAIREENENVLASDPELCQVRLTATPSHDHDDDSISLF